MKKFIPLFILLFLNSFLFAQKNTIDYLPAKNSTTPTWAYMLYEENINAIELQKAYDDYYTKNIFIKNEYTQYFKRWMRFNDKYINENGFLNINNVPTSTNLKSKYRAPNSEWSLLGPNETFRPSWDNAAQPAVPWQVNIYSFDIAPSNSNILFAAPETGGIFKSIDKGQNWISVSDTQILGNILSIAIHPTNSNIVYAGGSNSIYKSINGGNSWTTIYTQSNLNCNDLQLFPNNPDRILAATNGSLLLSTNAGLNWATTSNMTGVIYDIELNPINENSVYVLRKPNLDSALRFFLSHDGALNFTQVNTGWTANTSSAGRLSVSSADSNFIYAVLLIDGNIDAPHILRSTNAGNSWTHTCTGIQNSLTGNSSLPLGMSNGQGYYDLSIMASSLQANEVIVGTTTAYKSVDSGNTFAPVGGYVGSFPIHPDIQEMKMIGNDAWISTDGGLTLSSDFFTSTSNAVALNKGIYGVDFWGFGQGWNEDVTCGGRYHNGNTAMYDTYGFGKSLRLGGGEAPTGYAMIGNRERHVAHSDIGTDIIPTTFSGGTGSFGFSIFPNEDGYGWDASEVEFYPTCYNHIFIGKDSSLWKSIDGGISYTEVYNFNQRVKKFEICRSNPDVMYLATHQNLYKTTNAGATWSVITRPVGCAITRLAITVSFTDENVLWITSRYNTSNNKIFKSIDGGATWVNLTTPLINGYNFYTINHQAGTNGGVYITANDGGKVFYRNNTMNDWADFSSKLPREYNPLSAKPFYKKSKFRNAGNRGIWEVDFYEPSLPLAQPTVNILKSYCPRDTFYFEDFSVLDHTNATWNWSFPGASFVSNANIRNPKVLYSSTGIYTASLTISDGTNSSSKSIQVEVLNSICEADSIPGFAVQLDGNASAEYISIPPLGLNTNELSVSAWIKIDGIQPDYSAIFMHDGDAAGFNFVPGNNHIGFHWSGGAWWWDSGLEVPQNEWTHVAMTVSPTGVTVYVNGKSATNNFAVPTMDFTQNTFRLGSYRGWGGRFVKGIIDEVAIYNKTLTGDEIRATRHLTKVPNLSPNLIAYYQFNENNGFAFDKVANRHASLFASRILSTGPFARGNSFKLNVNSGGLKDFVGTDVKLAFSNQLGTILPDGDVYVSKLNYNPHLEANPFAVKNNYWIINNYGTNSTFSALDSISFSAIPQFANVNPADYILFKRTENNEGNSWGSNIDACDNYLVNGNNSSMNFENIITSSGQLSLNSVKALEFPNNIIDNGTHINDLKLYPNPSNSIVYIELENKSSAKNSELYISDASGKIIFQTKQQVLNGKNKIMLNIAPLANGTYFIKMKLDEITYNKTFQVLK